jgi:hypothetical protein
MSQSLFHLFIQIYLTIPLRNPCPPPLKPRIPHPCLSSQELGTKGGNTVMTHDSSYNKCSYITPTLSHLIPLRSDENPQRTFYFLHHNEPAVVSYNAQHRTKDYVSLIEVLLNVPLTFATSRLQTRHSGFHRAERTKLHRNFAPNHPN